EHVVGPILVASQRREITQDDRPVPAHDRRRGGSQVSRLEQTRDLRLEDFHAANVPCEDDLEGTAPARGSPGMSSHPPFAPDDPGEDVDAAGEATLPDEPQPSAFESLLRHVARAPVDAAAPLPGELTLGMIVAGRFELMREIGRGGFARVFEARDRVLSRPVAIKLLKRRRRLNDSELELFHRQARATARLNHPHIVTAYDWGAWNDTPFLVLELLDGESLDKQLEHGPMAEERAWEIVTEVAQALAYAHSLGVLHLDLKVQNVFVLKDGRVKVLDFGLAGLDCNEEIPGPLGRVGGA